MKSSLMVITMPTIKIHYTNNINIDDKLELFTENTHQMLVDVIATDIDTCRTLVYPCSQYRVGSSNSEYNAFIQLDIAILQGRSVELRKKLGQILLNDLRKLCKDSSQAIDFRVNVNETDTEFYFGL